MSSWAAAAPAGQGLVARYRRQDVAEPHGPLYYGRCAPVWAERRGDDDVHGPLVHVHFGSRGVEGAKFV